MKVKEFIDFINSREFWHLDELDNSDLEEIKDAIVVEEYSSLERHRWFSTAVTVYKLEDGFVGVSGICDIFTDWDDYKVFGIKCHAGEMIEVPTITYKWKA